MRGGKLAPGCGCTGVRIDWDVLTRALLNQTECDKALWQGHPRRCERSSLLCDPERSARNLLVSQPSPLQAQLTVETSTAWLMLTGGVGAGARALLGGRAGDRGQGQRSRGNIHGARCRGRHETAFPSTQLHLSRSALRCGVSSVKYLEAPGDQWVRRIARPDDIQSPQAVSSSAVQPVCLVQQTSAVYRSSPPGSCALLYSGAFTRCRSPK